MGKRNTPASGQAETNAEKAIYLGPSMLEKDGAESFQITYGTVYANGVPDDVAKRQKADADFARMFVPVGKAPKAMADLSKPGTPLYEARGRVKSGYIARKGRR